MIELSKLQTVAQNGKKELADFLLENLPVKPEHIEKYPDLHDLFWKTMKISSKTRQQASLEAAEELLEAVRKIAEIFWATKGAKTQRQPSLQASGGELVYPLSK